MPRLTLIAAMLPATALAACAMQPMNADGEDVLAVAPLQSADGSSRGTATFVRMGDHVAVTVEAMGLPAGTHGFHLHTTGRCDAPDFTSAGGHLNPTNNEHGSANPQGKHFGDLPNIEVAANGRASAEFMLPGATAATLATLFDSDGTAVMVHAGPDDYRSDPAGDAGPRIACGVVRRS